jgi:hypothetical protein
VPQYYCSSRARARRAEPGDVPDTGKLQPLSGLSVRSFRWLPPAIFLSRDSRAEGSNSPWNSRTRYSNVSTAALISFLQLANSCSSTTNNSKTNLNVVSRAKRSGPPRWEQCLPVITLRWRPGRIALAAGKRQRSPLSQRKAVPFSVVSAFSRGGRPRRLPDRDSYILQHASTNCPDAVQACACQNLPVNRILLRSYKVLVGIFRF